MRSLLRASLPVLVLTAFAAGCGDDSEPAQAGKSDKPNQPISYKEAKDKVDVKEVQKGEVTIRNLWGNRVECDVPGYKGGTKFGIDESSAKIVRADQVDGKKIVDVTCGDQRVSALNVTPDTEGADLEYVNEITFRKSGFNYLHSHLDFRNLGCQGDRSSVDNEWAVARTGSCVGTYLQGSPPYIDDRWGISLWERMGGSSNKIPRAVRGLGGPNESLIKITNAQTGNRPFTPTPGTAIECYIQSRSSGDCYTDFREQQGKPAGSQGGPLQITVENGTFRSERYAFIRGFCRRSDPMCTPH